MPSLYEIKKVLMQPWKLYMRRKENLDPGFMRSALELHYYRPAFYGWIEAVGADPELLYAADIDENSLVLDVGAYVGEWAEEIVKRYDPRIIAFEPDPGNYTKLARYAEDHPKVTPFAYGVADKTETLEMALQYMGSSVYEKNFKKKKMPTAQVEIRDIFQVFEDLQLGDVDLMKINVEGAEFPMMERMIETGILGRVRTYLIQFHEWHPGAYGRRRRIRRALAATHRLEWDHHFIWEKWVRK